MNELDAMREKNERNARISTRYNELMEIGRHGHYETMFRVVREEIERDRKQRPAREPHEGDRTVTVKTYDTACSDLAETFLQDIPSLWTKDRVHRLALEIQQTVEDFIADEQRNYEPPDRGDAWSGGFADNH